MIVGSVSCNGVVLCCSRLRLATSESSFVYFIGFGINKIVAVQKKNYFPSIVRITRIEDFIQYKNCKNRNFIR